MGIKWASNTTSEPSTVSGKADSYVERVLTAQALLRHAAIIDERSVTTAEAWGLPKVTLDYTS